MVCFVSPRPASSRALGLGAAEHQEKGMTPTAGHDVWGRDQVR
jgi:hypothetical protein